MKNKYFVLIGLILGLGLAYGIFLILNTSSVINLEANSVIVLTDRDYFPVAKEAIANSKESLHFSLFELKYYTSEKYKDSNENQLVEEVIRAKQRGIEVKIIVDEFGNKYGDVDEVINMLRDYGIIIKFDNPKTTTHTKLLIIDNEIVIIGSTNWSHFALDRNHEASVLIKSKKLAQDFEKYFEKLWVES